MKKANTADLLKCLFFILYFVILTAERIISLFSQVPFMFIEGRYEVFKGGLVILSLAAGWGYLLIRGRGIFRLKAPKIGNDFLQPSVAAGLLLISGMVHSRGTVAPIQFVSYGFLLAAMGIYTAECVKAKGESVLRWLSFAYITAFSMSVPVMYDTTCGCNLCIAFSVTQIWVSLGLVACFTVMLYRFFKDEGLTCFRIYEIVLALIGDGAVLFLRWHREINFFVLFAIVTAAMLWSAGKIICQTKDI
ncbi:MAG: hypothetical protein K2K41_03210, partial [Ruminiclostridium sp.]|nr:hypothetical protein [Ruminiclostridium sp.]